MFYLIIFSIPIVTLLFWWAADKRLRGRADRRLRLGRIALAAFMVFQILYFSRLILGRAYGWAPAPMIIETAGYVWYLAVLPFVTLPVLVYMLAEGSYRFVRRWRERHRQPLVPPAPAGPQLSRREVLSLGMALAPPALALLGTGAAHATVTGFRIRQEDLPLSGLPPEFDGLRVVHLSDTHVGRFTNGGTLDRMVEAINDLDPDIVAMTGDLINNTLKDLPEAMAMMGRLRARHGVYVCEGNHDLFEGREGFERGVREGGIPLLLNESATLEIAGRRLEILGLRWGAPGRGRGALIAENMAALEQVRDHSADFSMLLAHHPHAFDIAADSGIPLTLAGHTHGGQLMLLPGFGIGNLMYKYCTGIYRVGAAALSVSNGAGNWMPLRINAPAEIVALTLRREG